MKDSSSKVDVRGKVPSDIWVTPLVQRLLEQILMQAQQSSTQVSSSPNDPSAQDDVVLDVRVDGVRYTLTRYPTEPFPQPSNLSPRETEIVRLVAKGFPNKTIAAVLDISPWTVATHLRRIFAKLGVSSRAEMVVRALQSGNQPKIDQ